MLNSPNSVNRGGSTYLAADALSAIVTESIIPLLPPDRYLLPLTSLNRYLPMGNNEVLVFTSSSGNAGNVSVARHRMSATFGFCHNSLNSVKIIQRKVSVFSPEGLSPEI